eukprot:10471773-Ditylum_brightwellii.AAC.1
MKEYEAHVVHKDDIGPYKQQQDEEQYLIIVSITLGCLSKNKCSIARKLLKSHGLSDIHDDAVLEQLRQNYHHGKETISDLIAEQLAVPRQGIFPNHLQKAICELSSDVTPGP